VESSHKEEPNLNDAAKRFVRELRPDSRERTLRNIAGKPAKAVKKAKVEPAAAADGLSYGLLYKSLVCTQAFRKLNERDHVVLAALIASRNKDTGESFPGMNTLKELTGMDTRRVTRAITSLVDCGIIHRLHTGCRRVSATFTVANDDDGISRNLQFNAGHPECPPLE
jgi:predicted transcriptional regulator